MARVAVRRLLGEDVSFAGADLSTQLKLLGVDVASFGDPFADLARPDGVESVVVEDPVAGVYQKLLVANESSPTHRARCLGGVLVGDAGAFGALRHPLRDGDPDRGLAAPAPLWCGPGSRRGPVGRHARLLVPTRSRSATCGTRSATRAWTPSLP